MRNLIHSCLMLCIASSMLLVWNSCSKEDSAPEQPLSSEKNLNGFVFKASDNPALQVDINGTVSGDSVKVIFPQGISLNNLIPTIDFTGASIIPANRAAQNFTNPVTYKITAQDGSTKNYSFNSSFQIQVDTVTTVTARWGVIKDSVTNMNYTFPSGGFPIPGVYFGVANDYYDFNSNGTLYVFENNNSANAPYQVLSNGRISIMTSFNYECAIQYLTSNRMTLYWAFTSSGGGQYTRTLYLKK